MRKVCGISLFEIILSLGIVSVLLCVILQLRQRIDRHREESRELCTLCQIAEQVEDGLREQKNDVCPKPFHVVVVPQDDFCEITVRGKVGEISYLIAL